MGALGLNTNQTKNMLFAYWAVTPPFFFFQIFLIVITEMTIKAAEFKLIIDEGDANHLKIILTLQCDWVFCPLVFSLNHKVQITRNVYFRVQSHQVRTFTFLQLRE